MKKQYLILILLIVVLSGYLIVKKEDRRHYTLPSQPAVTASEVDRLIIKKQTRSIEFTRKEDFWVITDNEYPVDDTAMSQMLDVVSQLTLTALVSENQDTIRYELDDEHGVDVTAYSGNTPLLSFKIGKNASTFNHTFVMLKNDPNIYHAKDSFRMHFDKTVAEFRDKQVLDFSESTIKKISIQIQEKNIHLTARDLQNDNIRADQSETGQAPTEIQADQSDTSQALAETRAAGSETVFRYEDGSSPDPKTVSNLLSTLAGLTCDRFLDNPDTNTLGKEPPHLKITLENDEPIVLSVFNQATDDQVFGISSMNGYAFAFKNHVAKDLQSYARELAGLSPEKEADTPE